MLTKNDIDAHLVASRTHDLALSAIKEMSIRSAKVPGAVSLAWGLPSFRTPGHIRDAVTKALDSDPALGMYALPAGLPDLRQAVAQHHLRRTGRRVDPETNVLITAGNMEGLNTLFAAIIDPGDEVIVTDPGFVSHFSQIRFCGGVPVYWKMNEANGWDLDPETLPALIGPRTKAIVLVNPSNPTGSILSENAMRVAAEIAKEHGLLIILDDPYSLFVYENTDRFFNLAAAPEYADNLVYLFTFSKSYAMSGWRVGYMVLPEDLHVQGVKIHDLTMICTPRISQIAALTALQQTPFHLGEFQQALAKRRALMTARLDRLAHVFDYVPPEGAYYVFPRLLDSDLDSVAFAHDLLEKARVTVTPGSAFGPSGEDHVRMAYCVGEDTINQAFDRMEAYFGT